MALPAARIALGGIIHETHSFAEPLTTLGAFKNQALHQSNDILQAMVGTRSAVGGMIQGATDFGWALQPTVYAAAVPAGIVTETAYQTILQELLACLAAAMPLDGVLLALPGAMVTLDPESHILEQVRQIVGPETPIAVVLDMHGNITSQTVGLANRF